jgi:hypothetical protein
MNSLANRWLKECVELCICKKIDDTYDKNLSRLADGSLVRFPFNLFHQIL